MRSFVLLFFCSLVVLIFYIHCPCVGSMFPSAVALLLSFHYHMSPLVSCCLCRFLLFNQIYCYLLFPIMLLCGIPLHIPLSQLPHVHISSHYHLPLHRSLVALASWFLLLSCRSLTSMIHYCRVLCFLRSIPAAFMSNLPLSILLIVLHLHRREIFWSPVSNFVVAGYLLLPSKVHSI
jgi:hypothetical protein